ncbi:hypothetical protein ACSBL2_02285 [Pedobacter sp. AW31-3R]|uniref:hypothetical protein n=1 Tax=Pedobacter sp. AW31-3R TaxID=3445781 RepID=UPI003F9FB52B
MLIKMNLTLPTLARQERTVRKDIVLSRQQWIVIDRIVMMMLFIAAITGVVLIS